MGEVYRAEDTKLNRDVALKILPQQFASAAQRMARFQREAEVLASLDHPNIGQIYGIEEEAKPRPWFSSSSKAPPWRKELPRDRSR